MTLRRTPGMEVRWMPSHGKQRSGVSYPVLWRALNASADAAAGKAARALAQAEAPWREAVRVQRGRVSRLLLLKLQACEEAHEELCRLCRSRAPPAAAGLRGGAHREGTVDPAPFADRFAVDELNLHSTDFGVLTSKAVDVRGPLIGHVGYSLDAASLSIVILIPSAPRDIGRSQYPPEEAGEALGLEDLYEECEAAQASRLGTQNGPAPPGLETFIEEPSAPEVLQALLEVPCSECDAAEAVQLCRGMRGVCNP